MVLWCNSVVLLLGLINHKSREWKKKKSEKKKKGEEEENTGENFWVFSAIKLHIPTRL